MATKPENLMLRNVMNHFQGKHKMAYAEKTNNPFRSGMWDYYLEFEQQMAWLEGKYWNRKYSPDLDFHDIWNLLTVRQQHWGFHRLRHGRRCIILCGFNDKHYLLLPMRLRHGLPVCTTMTLNTSYAETAENLRALMGHRT